MIELIIEQIEKRARIEHGGDFDKAACSYFHDHPSEWDRYKDEVTVVTKRSGADPEIVNAELQFKVQMVAHRDHLDLDRPAHRVIALEKAVTEHPELYRQYQAANSVQVGRSVSETVRVKS